MKLRDYFAGQALIGMLSHPETELDRDKLHEYMIDVFAIADAMLSARGVGSGVGIPLKYTAPKGGYRSDKNR